MGSRDDAVIKSVGGLVVKLLALGGVNAQALALEGEPVGVAQEATKDGVGNGWIADDLVLMLDRATVSRHGRAVAIAILHHFQQVE
ncbi:hypothetical protein ABIF66_002331 [Bradyrhizobium japonicum]